MVPVGGEETPPVIETAAEADHRDKQEAKDVEHQAWQKEYGQINKVFNVFAQRARIANKIESMRYTNYPDESSFDVAVVRLGDQEYYQPIVYLSKTDYDRHPHRCIITADGSIHSFVHEQNQGLHIISLPDKNGNRHPLFPGADKDSVLAKMDDDIPSGVEYTLDDGRKVWVGKSYTNTENSHGLREIKEKLVQTAGLAKKLVTGEPVPQA